MDCETIVGVGSIAESFGFERIAPRLAVAKPTNQRQKAIRRSS